MPAIARRARSYLSAPRAPNTQDRRAHNPERVIRRWPHGG